MSYLEKFYDEWHNSAGDNRSAEIRDRDLMALDYLQDCKSVIELGCGSGVILNMLNAPHKTGVDISAKAIEIARHQVQAEDGVDLQVVDIDNDELPFPEKSFDGALASEVLEHLFDPVHALAELNRMLRTDGKLIVTVPNIGYHVYRYYHLISGEVSDFHGNGLIVNEHIRYYGRDSLAKLLELTGFSVVRVLGCMKTVVSQANARQGKRPNGGGKVLRALKAIRPTPLNIMSKSNRLFRLWKRFPSLFAVGLVIEARKVEESKHRYNPAVDHQERTPKEEQMNVNPCW